ncbi:hypothetical protein [Melissospora conviva]|uniref:hypothetical protein n=1 Tax=Melissospora conviva TaxID=3388432 RepID=UPI003C148C73
MYGHRSGRDPRNAAGTAGEATASSPQPPPGPSPARFPTPELHRAQPGHHTRTAQPGNPPADLPPPHPFGHRRGARRPGTGGQGRLLVGGLAVVLLLVVSAVATTVLLSRGAGPGSADELTAPVAAPNPSPSPTPSARSALADPLAARLASRDADPAPLTVAEVFGAPAVGADSGTGYEVLRTQQRRDCAAAATGEIGDLLNRFGCTQVVRATLRSADGERLATAGLFNLTDTAGAVRADERIKVLLGEGRGRFPGLPAGSRTEALTEAESQVSWQAAGHYLIYCVVVRVDGQAAAVDDPHVRALLADLLDGHLRQGVLAERAGGTPGPARTD